MVTYAPHTSTDALNRARNWIGKKYPIGWCQKFVVAEIFGTGGVGDFDGDGAADAEDGWKAAVMRGRVVHAHDLARYEDIPAGVPLYWSGGSHDNGHAAISDHAGFIISTDQPRMGYIGRVKLSDIATHWGLTFLGYVLVTGNGYTVTDKPSGPVDKMDPKNYGPGKSGPHITWLGQRLVAHGFGSHYKSGPGPVWGDSDRLNVRDFQLAQGWKGDNADGLPGPETLRRLAADPKSQTWSTRTGLHRLTGVWKLEKSGVVAKVHDGNQDIIDVRLKDKRLFVEGQGKDIGTLDADYKPGTSFTLTITATKGGISVSYELCGKPAVTQSRKGDWSGLSFKAVEPASRDYREDHQ